MDFHQHGRGATDPKNPSLIQEERHMMEHFWYAVANGRHGVWIIFRSWEEASEFFLESPGALVENPRRGYGLFGITISSDLMVLIIIIIISPIFILLWTT